MLDVGDREVFCQRREDEAFQDFNGRTEEGDRPI